MPGLVSCRKGRRPFLPRLFEVVKRRAQERVGSTFEHRPAHRAVRHQVADLETPWCAARDQRLPDTQDQGRKASVIPAR
jgi:hypothetical protein